MITKDQALELRGQRVFAKLADGTEANWIFRAWTPSDKIVFAGEGGRERVEDATAVLDIYRDPVVCPECQTEHNVDRPSQRCAECERQFAYKQPAPSETCEACGSVGAVYSPLAKRFLCLQDLAKGGFLTGLGPEARVLTQGAICRSDDIHSDRHIWRRTKSSFVCTECKSKVFEKPAGYVG